jgi:NAD(P)-dependent dehydrogenase (short-subunit alcohol dehydrogenase family)
MPGVEGRVALVTGGDRGIGRAAAELPTSRGAKVTCVARSLRDLVDVEMDGGPFGITSNAVLPGWVRTDMAERSARQEVEDRGITTDLVWEERAALYPPGRAASPREVSEVIAFLVAASVESRSGSPSAACCRG